MHRQLTIGDVTNIMWRIAQLCSSDGRTIARMGYKQAGIKKDDILKMHCINIK